MLNSNALGLGSYSERLSEFEAIVLAPLFHDLNKVLNLWVVSVFEHLDHFYQPLFGFFASLDHLEDSYCRTSLALPEFRVRVQSLEDIEGLDGVIEEPHLIAIVCYQVEKTKRLIRGFHVDVDLPCKVRFLIHYVAPAQPAQVYVLALVLVALDLKKSLLGILKVSR